MSENERDADKAEEILSRRDATGAPVYDQVVRDAKSGEWTARRSDDHAVTERVTPQ